tara:strand:+ start:3577 stop:4731 length:1155 start_codon:yes stop_codon:yes gene_type:complete
MSGITITNVVKNTPKKKKPVLDPEAVKLLDNISMHAEILAKLKSQNITSGADFDDTTLNLKISKETLAATFPSLVKKKRGRKPKKKDPNDKPKEPRRRGRKPKHKRYVYNPENNTNTIEDDNIIIHLPLKNIKGKSDAFEYDPVIQTPSAYSTFTSFETLESSHGATVAQTIPVVAPGDTTRINIASVIAARHEDISNMKIPLKPNTILPNCISLRNSKAWPMKSNICCWWCTEKFTCRPCCLPKYKLNDTFHATGVFCSPECTAAYNFDNPKNNDVWEQYSLLNLLYKSRYKENIPQAPPRELLKKFGGSLTIEQFRGNNLNTCSFNVVHHPIKSLLSTHECSNSQVGYNEHLNYSSASDLKIKRKKKTLNTLESCMNIHITK